MNGEHSFPGGEFPLLLLLYLLKTSPFKCCPKIFFSFFLVSKVKINSFIYKFPIKIMSLVYSSSNLLMNLIHETFFDRLLTVIYFNNEDTKLFYLFIRYDNGYDVGGQVQETDVGRMYAFYKKKKKKKLET